MRFAPMSSYSLDQLRPGQSACIVRIDGVGGTRLRLQELGLLPGTTVEFVRAAPLGDPIEVRVRGYHLSLRRQEAGAVVIDLLERQP
jgi:Fe2+ transport system protein FeoA